MSGMFTDSDAGPHTARLCKKRQSSRTDKGAEF